MSEQLSDNAFRNIVDTCRAPATRNAYTKSLRLFLKYLRLEETDYDKLIEKDPKIIQQDICDYILYMRKRGLSSASVSTYLSGLVKFYSMMGCVQSFHHCNLYPIKIWASLS